MAGLYAPLPTLRRRPRGRLRTDRGRRGLLLLHRSGLSPHTPCQSPGALTRVAACTLARSPIVTANRRLQPFRYLHDCSDCFRLERIAGWASHPLESAAFSRRTPEPVIYEGTLARRPLPRGGPCSVRGAADDHNKRRASVTSIQQPPRKPSAPAPHRNR